VKHKIINSLSGFVAQFCNFGQKNFGATAAENILRSSTGLKHLEGAIFKSGKAWTVAVSYRQNSRSVHSLALRSVGRDDRVRVVSGGS
jgi:hypothetical protein